MTKALCLVTYAQLFEITVKIKVKSYTVLAYSFRLVSKSTYILRPHLLMIPTTVAISLGALVPIIRCART